MAQEIPSVKTGRPDIEFRGTAANRLSPESAEEFYELLRDWGKFDNPMEQLQRWCDHYYSEGDKFVPINFAVDLWEKEDYRDQLWPYVCEEYRRYKDELDQHGASPETIADIRERLEEETK